MATPAKIGAGQPGIDAFVDNLDLEETGFQRVRPNDKGRPGYDPADLLRLYIYGTEIEEQQHRGGFVLVGNFHTTTMFAIFRFLD